MSHSLEIPLHLFEVLEEEYVSLHGPIPAEEDLTIKLRNEEEGEWRVVRAARNWFFDEGHIIDPVGFALNVSSLSELQDQTLPDSKNVRSYDWMKENLKEYLRGKISDQTLKNLIDWHHDEGALRVPPREMVKPLEDALNELLTDQNLYDPDRFSDNWLSDTSKGLVNLRSSFMDSDDELRHFNRLLLEDAFPEALEKVSNIRLAAMCQRFHAVQQKALCLSGGGIRSGTFALGVLQGLARHDLLRHFDYLSTVSGGGYIGSWLTAWIHRHPEGLQGVTNELATSNLTSKIDPEPQPIRYLRRHSHLIMPKLSGLNTDTWAFVSNYFMNLFLNWLVFIPLLVAAMTIPRLALAITQMQPEPLPGQDQPEPLIKGLFGRFDFQRQHIFLILGFALGVWALTYIIFNRPGIREQLQRRSRFWRDRPDQWSFLRWCLLPLVGSSFCLTTYWAWSRELHDEPTSIFGFLLFGVSFTFLAWLIASIVIRRRLREINLIELAALLFAGVISGLFFWVLEQPYFTSPVIGYYKSVDRSFDWTTTDWAAWKTELYVVFAVPVFLLLLLLGATFFVGVSSASKRITDEVREWWVRLGAWLLIAIIIWSVSTALVFFSPIALLNAPRILASIGGLSALIAILIGRSSKTSSGDKSAGEKVSAKDSVVTFLSVRLLPLLAFAFLVPFIAAVSLATSGLIASLANLAKWFNENTILVTDDNLEWLTNAPTFVDYLGYIFPQTRLPVSGAEYAQIVHMNVLHHTSTWFILGLGLFMLAFSGMLALLINVNIYSLRAIYRNRLIKVFLAASRPERDRRPNPFTGFDPADNLHMHELRPKLLDETDFGQTYPNTLKNSHLQPFSYKMLHVINAALNRAGEDEVAWQERKADPFSITPLHSGCFRLGYRRTRDYGGRETGGISIGTAAAISAAAANSNIGFYKHPANLSLLLTLFNVLTLFNARLGWWLGNPGPAGDQTYHLRAPRYTYAPVLYEAFGLSDNRSRYVYLTDGGHFENLAIYEMVLRRCHIIVVTDGAQDEDYSFSDLGNAVRKIRIDLGVPIEFTSVPIYAESPSKEKQRGMYWAIGRIRYRAIDGPDARDGVLLYIKPAVYGDEPRDILQYKKVDPTFPHQSIGNQFFDEPQFESYRILGSYIMDQLCGQGTEQLDLHQLVGLAYRKLTEATDDLKAADPQLKVWLSDWLPRQPRQPVPIDLTD